MKKSIVYIGKNGVGKSKQLQENLKKYNSLDGVKAFLFDSSENYSPDELMKSEKKDTIWANLQSFITQFVIKENITMKDLQEKFENKLNDKIKNIESKNNDFLKEFWKEIIKYNILEVEKNESPFMENEKKFKMEAIFKPLEFDFKKIKKLPYWGSGNNWYFIIIFISTFLIKLPEEYFNNNDDDALTLLIDEPERFLHPSLIRDVAYKLKKINDKINIIVSTHSPEFLMYFYTENTIVKHKKNNKDSNWNEIKFDNWVNNGFKRRRESFEISFSDKIIICEGENDTKLVEDIIYKNDFNSHICIINPGNGKSDIPILYKSILKIWNNIITKEDIFVIFDKDKAKINSLIDHEKINKNIEDLKINLNNFYFFKDDLETAFNISKNSKFIPDEHRNKILYKELENKIKLFTEKK